MVMFRDWVAQQNAGQNQNAAPQPFENKPVTYIYHARKNGDPAPPLHVEAPKPAVPVTQSYWPYPQYYPTPYTYMQYPQYYPVAAPAAPPPAPAPPAPAPIYYPQPQPAYYPYPTGYYPPAPPAPALAAAPKKYDWWGRTRDEVLHDNQVAAAATGGNDAHQWAPQGVADDTMFHVLEKDGVSQTLYPIGTIKSLKGYWNTHNGVLYFVRNKD